MPTQALNASPDATAQAFLKNLRAQTAPAHEQLEAHPISQSITTPDVTAADYLCYLQIMQRVVEGLEAVLNPALHSLLPDVNERSKQSWLSDDLGKAGGQSNPYPAFRCSTNEENSAYALGSFYVLEGSTLGGRVILKSLPPALHSRARYFEGYGMQTGAMWQSFLAILCNAATSPEAQHSIINGATDTFAAIYRYFNTCLAHEAKGHRQS